jgi:hypothetical protein
VSDRTGQSGTSEPPAVAVETNYGAAGVFNAPVTVFGRTPVSWPHRIGTVPGLAHCRQDRPVDRDVASVTAWADTDEATGTSDAAAPSPPGPDAGTRNRRGAPTTVFMTQVLAGLGGVGKTQLAAALAHRVWDQQAAELLVWVTASSRDAIVTAYAQAARDVTGIDDDEPEQAAARFLAWLHHSDQRRRWLIVLDDVQQPGDLVGLWPPTSLVGRTVVTTRRRDTAMTQGRHLVEVGLFTPAQARAYLSRKLGDDPPLLEEADGLAADLGYLPLALAQATTYLLDRGLTCASYRARFNDRRRTLTRLTPDPGALPDEHRDTIATTWSLSIDLADTQAPEGLARPVLHLASLLDPNAIPADLFSTNTMLHQLNTTHAPENSRPEVHGDDVRDALHTLHRLNLITIDAHNGAEADRPEHEPDVITIRVHALIQRAVRDTIALDRIPDLRRTAADALRELWPDVDRDVILRQALRANAGALTSASSNPLRDDTGFHPVLFRAGNSLGENGQPHAAVDYFRTLHVQAVHDLGPQHPDTLNTRSDLAYWRGKSGDATGAATAFEHLLTDHLRVLGPDHPDTLTTRANLAHWRGESGDAAETATAFEQLLTDRLRVLGPDHPRTLATRSNLARWRGESGDAAGAATATQQLLTDRLRVLGPDHRDTLTSRGNLARWRGESGDAAGAVTVLEQLLADHLRVLGPEHPDTLTTRSDLAQWRGKSGDAAGAAAAFEQLLTDRLRVLGLDHPDTLGTRHNLAHWQKQISGNGGRP